MSFPKRAQHDAVNQALSKITSDLKHQLIHLFDQIADSQTESVARLQEQQEALLKENDRLRALLGPTDACVPAAEPVPGDPPTGDHPAVQFDIKSPRPTGLSRSCPSSGSLCGSGPKSRSRLFDSEDEGENRSKFGGDASTRSQRTTSAKFELLPFWQKIMNSPDGLSPQHHRSFRWSVSRRTKNLKVECHRTTSGLSRISLVTTNPMSYKRLGWEGIGVALVMYDLIVTPLEFFDVFYRPMMYFIATYWTFEMFSSFLVGYKDRGVLEFRMPKVVKRYLRTWFCSDLILVISDWILVAFDTLQQSNRVAGLDYLQIGRVVRALRFLRLIRLLRLHSFVGRIYESFQSPYVLTLFAVSKFICFILILAHFVACGWYGLGDAVRVNGKSWIQENFSDTDRFWFRYSTSLHWSLTQFTPASMEVVPVNAAERIYACLVIAVAMVVFSSFISAITEAMTQVRKAYSQKNEQSKELRRYFTDNNISHQLAIRIWKYFEHGARTKRQRKTWKEVNFFNQLPAALQQDLHYEVYLPVIQMHPMFEVYGDRNAAAARAICHKVVEEVIITDNQKLFAMGELADKMYFVTEGALAYHLGGDGIEPRDKVLTQPVPVYPDQWVSEAAVWLRWFHQGDMIPQQSSHLVSLQVAQLQEILQQYVDMIWECLTYAKLFQEYAEATEDISDLQGDVGYIQRMVDQAFPNEGGEFSRDTSDSAGSMGEPVKRPSMIQNILQMHTK